MGYQTVVPPHIWNMQATNEFADSLCIMGKIRKRKKPDYWIESFPFESFFSTEKIKRNLNKLQTSFIHPIALSMWIWQFPSNYQNLRKLWISELFPRLHWITFFIFYYAADSSVVEMSIFAETGSDVHNSDLCFCLRNRRQILRFSLLCCLFLLHTGIISNIATKQILYALQYPKWRS